MILNRYLRENLIKKQLRNGVVLGAEYYPVFCVAKCSQM